MSSPKDKLSRASWTLLESTKDSAITTIATAIQEGRIKLDQNHARILQDLMIRSIEAGYHRAYNAFMKEVDVALEEAIHDAVAKKK